MLQEIPLTCLNMKSQYYEARNFVVNVKSRTEQWVFFEKFVERHFDHLFLSLIAKLNKTGSVRIR
jgi:hypothetical protein